MAAASLSSLVGDGYLQHDGPCGLGRSESDRLIGEFFFYTSPVKCLFPPKKHKLLCSFVVFFKNHLFSAALFSDAARRAPKI